MSPYRATGEILAYFLDIMGFDSIWKEKIRMYFTYNHFGFSIAMTAHGFMIYPKWLVNDLGIAFRGKERYWTTPRDTVDVPLPASHIIASLSSSVIPNQDQVADTLYDLASSMLFYSDYRFLY